MAQYLWITCITVNSATLGKYYKIVIIILSQLFSNELVSFFFKSRNKQQSLTFSESESSVKKSELSKNTGRDNSF